MDRADMAELGSRTPENLMALERRKRPMFVFLSSHLRGEEEEDLLRTIGELGCQALVLPADFEIKLQSFRA
jgi:hypothetical protein